jgi:hypothetical protein
MMIARAASTWEEESEFRLVWREPYLDYLDPEALKGYEATPPKPSLYRGDRQLEPGWIYIRWQPDPDDGAATLNWLGADAVYSPRREPGPLTILLAVFRTRRLVLEHLRSQFPPLTRIANTRRYRGDAVLRWLVAIPAPTVIDLPKPLVSESRRNREVASNSSTTSAGSRITVNTLNAPVSGSMTYNGEPERCTHLSRGRAGAKATVVGISDSMSAGQSPACRDRGLASLPHSS